LRNQVLSEEGAFLKVKNHASVKDDVGYKVVVTGDIDRMAMTISITTVKKMEHEGASCSRTAHSKGK
jgi:hypothetical protein